MPDEEVQDLVRSLVRVGWCEEPSEPRSEGEDGMRKLIVSEFVTLDGVMQAPGGPDEDRSGGFDSGGWQMNYFDDVFGKIVLEGLSDSDFLLGRRRTRSSRRIGRRHPRTIRLLPS